MVFSFSVGCLFSQLERGCGGEEHWGAIPSKWYTSPLLAILTFQNARFIIKKSVEHKSLESTVTFFIARITPNEPFLPILIANFFSGDEAGDKVAFSPLNKTKSSVTITNDMGLYTAVIWLYCTRKTEFQDFRYSHNRLVPGSSPGWLTNKSASAVRRKLFS